MIVELFAHYELKENLNRPARVLLFFESAMHALFAFAGSDDAPGCTVGRKTDSRSGHRSGFQPFPESGGDTV